MNRHSKSIKATLRPDIERVKSYIRDSKRGFDGNDSYVFKTAIRELRAEGFIIEYSKTTDLYYLINNK